MGFFSRLFGKKEGPKKSSVRIEHILGQGRAYVAAKEFERAKAEFLKAVEADPENADARYALSRTLARLGEHSRAADEFVESVKLSGETEDPEVLLEDAEGLGMDLTDDHRRRLAGALTAGLAEGRFVLLHEGPFDEEEPPLTPSGLFLSVSYRQIRDLLPLGAAIALMMLDDS